LPETDDDIDAVIKECQYRFNINIDRVFLGGQSMGGIGGYHLCQRLCDRIAGGFSSSGAWRNSYFRSILGTPFFILHGAHDSAPGVRGRSTDQYYARSADSLLTAAGVEHVYLEHPGGHSLKDAASTKKMVDWIEKTGPRDPFKSHICVVTPRGSSPYEMTPTPHNRWITIHEIGEEKIDYLRPQRHGPPYRNGDPQEIFYQQYFTLEKVPFNAGIVDAINKGDNVFEITTENVKSFSLWLHPKMVDFTQSIEVIVNGETKKYNAKPTLFDALRSYDRRKDWGLIYHSEIVVNISG
jgi:hypothetical protein